MAPRIVIIGGASLQWVPKLFLDVVNTPSLGESEIVLQDINPEPLPAMEDFVRHAASLKGSGITVRSTTDRRDALENADYVVVCISTGAFESMRHDLEIPERYGIKQSVGDTVGPGGIMRALRNIPVLLDVARDMEAICPDAWMFNITNPMTTLCRAVTRETTLKTVGLCHEVTGAQFTLSQILDVDFRSFDFEVVGVNHLPIITRLFVDGEDAMDRLRDKLADPEKLADEPIFLPDEIKRELGDVADEFTKRDLVTSNQVKFALFERFGALPGAGDRHLVEFFPGFLTEESEWGKRWNVHLTSIADREVWVERYRDEFAKLRAMTEVPTMPSGEMVAPMIDSFLRGKPRHLPLNLPNAGQCPDLPADAVVEAMVTASGDGLSGRDHGHAPPVLTEALRRIVASQEMTVEAAISGDRDTAVNAMLLDPLAGRIDFDHVELMTDEMLAATARWLPQFS
jgi:alpha-galactosidase/6-phospho-beta-glucosidase family protein